MNKKQQHNKLSAFLIFILIISWICSDIGWRFLVVGQIAISLFLGTIAAAIVDIGMIRSIKNNSAIMSILDRKIIQYVLGVILWILCSAGIFSYITYREPLEFKMNNDSSVEHICLNKLVVSWYKSDRDIDENILEKVQHKWWGLYTIEHNGHRFEYYPNWYASFDGHKEAIGFLTGTCSEMLHLSISESGEIDLPQ